MFIKELVLLLGPFGLLYGWGDAQYPHAEVAASTASQHTKILTQNAYTFQNTQLILHNLKATSALTLFKDARDLCNQDRLEYQKLLTQFLKKPQGSTPDVAGLDPSKMADARDAA